MSTESSSKTAESAPIFNIAKSTLISLNMSNITKLTATNFITWRLQVSALLEAHELHCFIDEVDQTPSSTITTDEGKTEPNPSFAAWNRQDRMLFSALLGSLSLAVQPIVARATKTCDVWQILYQNLPQQLPPSTSNTHAMTTRSKSNIHKPNQKLGLTAILSEVEPTSYVEALKDEKWRGSMSKEYDAFIRNDTFDLVDRSEANNIVGS